MQHILHRKQENVHGVKNVKWLSMLTFPLMKVNERKIFI